MQDSFSHAKEAARRVASRKLAKNGVRRGLLLTSIGGARRAINQYQGTGNCIFSNGILEYIEYTPISQARNEKELPDLIQCAIDDGHIVQSFLVGGRYININTFEDVSLAEEAVGAVAWAV